MGYVMGKVTMDRTQSASVDGFLREELARGNRARASVAPVFAHFLDSDGPSLFSDAIIASLRGQLDHLTRRLLSEAISEGGGEALQSAAHQALSNRLAGDVVIVDHLYSTALEGVIAKKLEQTCAIDPVLSPLLQELITSDKPAIAELAMSVLAAQSRFCLSHRRMELPLGELPFEVFARALEHGDAAVSESGLPSKPKAFAELKRGYDEGTNRIGLLARLTSAMKGGAVAGLDLAHAGFALFASSCAALLSLDREQAVFACHEGQSVRLALMLKAAGLSDDASERQIALLGGVKPLPSGLEAMSQAQARDVLASHVQEGGQ